MKISGEILEKANYKTQNYKEMKKTLLDYLATTIKEPNTSSFPHKRTCVDVIYNDDDLNLPVKKSQEHIPKIKNTVKTP